MAGNDLYTLVITESSAGRAYAPQGGDAYVLTIYNSTPPKTSSGTVSAVPSPDTFTLMPTGAQTSFDAKVEGGSIAALTETGTSTPAIIPLDGGDTVTAPASLTAALTYSGSVNGVSYMLTFTETTDDPEKAYTPLVDDPYTLTLSGGITNKSTGTISEVSDTTYTLEASIFPGAPFTATITGNTPRFLGIIHCIDKKPLVAGDYGIQTIATMDIPEVLHGGSIGEWKEYHGNQGEMTVEIFTSTGLWLYFMEEDTGHFIVMEGATFTPGDTSGNNNGIPEKPTNNEFTTAAFTVTGARGGKSTTTAYEKNLGMSYDEGNNTVWWFNDAKTRFAPNDDAGKERINEKKENE